MLDRIGVFNLINNNHVFKEIRACFFIVDPELRIHYLNYDYLGENNLQCPGDFLKCSNAVASAKEGGCGCHKHCRNCNFRSLVESCFETNERTSGKASLMLATGQELDLLTTATPISIEGQPYAIVLIEDITDQKQHLMLQRVFFHDLLNLSGTLNTILDCIDTERPEDSIDLIRGISTELMDEIYAQRDIIYANNGILKLEQSTFKAVEVINFAKDYISKVEKNLFGVNMVFNSSLADEEITSDKALVNRVILNMVKNACEASSAGQTVSVNAGSTEKSIIFSVHNPAVMSDEIKSKVFISGNTTKGMGHGLGTYSMKLIGESYLKGKVSFTSEEPDGTEFFFEISRSK